MIRFKQEWALNMDGGPSLIATIEATAEDLAMRAAPRGASDAVDYALALACDDAETAEEVYRHLGYIINQLEIARLNVRRSIPE
jgi:hypothetical protein